MSYLGDASDALSRAIATVASDPNATKADVQRRRLASAGYCVDFPHALAVDPGLATRESGFPTGMVLAIAAGSLALVMLRGR